MDLNLAMPPMEPQGVLPEHQQQQHEQLIKALQQPKASPPFIPMQPLPLSSFASSIPSTAPFGSAHAPPQSQASISPPRTFPSGSIPWPNPHPSVMNPNFGPGVNYVYNQGGGGGSGDLGGDVRRLHSPTTLLQNDPPRDASIVLARPTISTGFSDPAPPPTPATLNINVLFAGSRSVPSEASSPSVANDNPYDSGEMNAFKQAPASAAPAAPAILHVPAVPPVIAPLLLAQHDQHKPFAHRLPPQPLPAGIMSLDLAHIIKTYRFPHPDVLAALSSDEGEASADDTGDSSGEVTDSDDPDSIAAAGSDSSSMTELSADHPLSRDRGPGSIADDFNPFRPLHQPVRNLSQNRARPFSMGPASSRTISADRESVRSARHVQSLQQISLRSSSPSTVFGPVSPPDSRSIGYTPAALESARAAAIEALRGMAPSVASTDGKPLSDNESDTPIDTRSPQEQVKAFSAPLLPIARTGLRPHHKHVSFSNMQNQSLSSVQPVFYPEIESETPFELDEEGALGPLEEEDDSNEFEEDIDEELELFERELDGDFDDVGELRAPSVSPTPIVGPNEVVQSFDDTDDEDDHYHYPPAIPSSVQSNPPGSAPVLSRTEETAPRNEKSRPLSYPANNRDVTGKKPATRLPSIQTNRERLDSAVLASPGPPPSSSTTFSSAAASPLVKAHVRAMSKTHMPPLAPAQAHLLHMDFSSILLLGLKAWIVDHDVFTATQACFYACEPYWSEERVAYSAGRADDAVPSLAMYVLAHALFEGAGCKQDERLAVEVLEMIVSSNMGDGSRLKRSRPGGTRQSVSAVYSPGSSNPLTRQASLDGAVGSGVGSPSPACSVQSRRKSLRRKNGGSITNLSSSKSGASPSYVLVSSAWNEVQLYFSADLLPPSQLSDPRHAAVPEVSRSAEQSARTVRLATMRLAECYEIGRGVARSTETADYYCRVATALNGGVCDDVGTTSTVPSVVSKLRMKLHGMRIRSSSTSGSSLSSSAESSTKPFNPEDSPSEKHPLQNRRTRRSMLDSRTSLDDGFTLSTSPSKSFGVGTMDISNSATSRSYKTGSVLLDGGATSASMSSSPKDLSSPKRGLFGLKRLRSRRSRVSDSSELEAELAALAGYARFGRRQGMDPSYLNQV
ncbi:hypothetical protein DFJ73DRAFT_506486 [Zopfochytrium polystomum]|nr:hypothetical protein DFJ73DRAFT_506486 [Zopfochytrium polystomum]